MTELAGFDGVATQVAATGPSGGGVAHLALAANRSVAAFSVSIDTTSIRLEGVIRLSSAANAEGLRLFLTLRPDRQRRRDVDAQW